MEELYLKIHMLEIDLAKANEQIRILENTVDKQQLCNKDLECDIDIMSNVFSDIENMIKEFTGSFLPW